MQHPTNPESIPFHDPATARTRLESVQSQFSAQLLPSFLLLLADSPDPDWTLNQVERWLAADAEALGRFESQRHLLHYAVTVFGHSRYLGETLLRNGDLLASLGRQNSLLKNRSREDFHEAWARFRARSSISNSEPDVAVLLARFKRREYVRVLLRDVLKMAPLAEITQEISALSDVLIEEALRDATGRLQARYGAAQHLDPAGRRVETPFAVLALGKLGGQELNYSSDVDLLYVYGEEESAAGTTISHREYFVRLGQEVTRTLSRVTQEGPVFRIDMRLRPQGAEGELALSRRQMLAYYSETAQDWELQALIKMRFAAGDETLARECIRGVQPFVYRGAADDPAANFSARFTAIETALEARDRMIAKYRPGVATNTIDVKLDRGGIRDIEFLAQCLQRVHGGRELWLRSGGTIFALQKLHDKSHISGRDYQELTTAYEFFRQVEHRLQLRMGQQTHRLPSEPRELEIIQRSLADHAVLQHGSAPLGEALRQQMAAVSEIYWRIVHHHQRRLQEQSAESQFELSSRHDGEGELPYRAILDRLAQDAPQLFALTQNTVPGSLRRRNLQRFLGSIFTSSTRYAILLRHPEAFPQALNIFEASGCLTDVLVQYPEECVTLAEMAQYQEPVATGYLFAPPSRWESAMPDPVFQFAATSNSSHAEKLALLRRHYRHLSFVNGVRDLTESRPVYQSLSAQSATADDAIRAAFTMAGQPDGMAILAMGRLGTGEFDFFSDADLVFFRDESLTYEAAKKAAERIVHALAAYTREGLLFPVDTRLRPRGAEGELVLPTSAFAAYCQREAEPWEALSYTKLRFVCGFAGIAADARDSAETLFARIQHDGGFAASVHGMRKRLEGLESEKDWKRSPGGIYDIDFLTGFLLIQSGLLKKDGSLRDRLWRLADAGAITNAEAGLLDHATELLRTVEHVASLVTGRAQAWLPASDAALASTERWATEILRQPFPQGVTSAVLEAMASVRQIYEQRLG